MNREYFYNGVLIKALLKKYRFWCKIFSVWGYIVRTEKRKNRDINWQLTLRHIMKNTVPWFSAAVKVYLVTKKMRLI